MSKAKRKRSWHKLDPHYQQEKEKYGQAAPSRAFIAQVLEEQGVPMTYEMVRDHLGIDDEWESEALRRRLKAMERDGDLIRNRRGGYGVVSKMDLVKGKVLGHPEGFGFLVPDEGGEDLYISPRQMRQLLHGDRVVMRVAGVDRRGRKEGALVEILERTTQQVVGRFFKQRGFGFVVPDNRRVHQDILVPQEYQNKAKDNQIVVAELIEQPSKISPPIGRIKEVLGEHLAPGMEVQIALYSHDIPHEWPQEVKQEAGQVHKEVAEEDKQDRLDLRELPLVTIDGITARDFDDAVFCEKRGKNYRLIVAIADVSHYVKPGMALDGEAHNRGTSVYFPDRVIPMLPEVLSNGLCSLNPKVDRLCMVCDMTLNPEGKIVRSRFHEGVMRSHARLTYDAVAAMVVDQDERLRKEYSGLVKHLDRLYELFHILHEARSGRGAIDFETQETVIEYGPDRKIERIVPSSRNDAHRIIEECMITANVAAARFLQRHKMPTLYRIHEGPPLEKLEKLRGFLGEVGLGVGGGDKPTAKDYAVLLERVKGRPDFNLIQTVMLRSMSQAVYSPENLGHFGLSLENYCHFTSPIRRYPDLLVHRGIRHVIRGGKPKDFTYSPQDMVALGEHCSTTERRADEAVWDAIGWLKAEYMQDKVGDEFDALVTGVTSFGLFVELDQVFVEGLVHVTALTNDYYHFDPVGHRLTGERTGRTYRLGDALRVKVMRVDLDERKIDFDLVADHGAPKGKGGGGAKGARSGGKDGAKGGARGGAKGGAKGGRSGSGASKRRRRKEQS